MRAADRLISWVLSPVAAVTSHRGSGLLGRWSWRRFGGGYRRTRARVAVDPEHALTWTGGASSRAPSTPIWRLGVQCGRPVRDSARPAALARTNQVGWPSGLGMEPKPRLALPSGPSRRWRQREERRRKLRLRIIRVWNGRPATTGRPFFFRAATRSGSQRGRVSSDRMGSGTPRPPGSHKNHNRNDRYVPIPSTSRCPSSSSASSAPSPPLR